MGETPNEVQPKVEEPKVEEKVTDDQTTTPVVEKPAEKSEEEVKLEAKKSELEGQVSGLEGTIESLKGDIVRKRQERKETVDEPTPFDEEALMAKVDEKLQSQLKPVLEDNEKLRKEILKSNEEALKAKKGALDSINARIASATAAKPSVTPTTNVEEEVELSSEEARMAKELGLENPRYMKEAEVR